MTITIKNPEAARKLRLVAQRLGTTIPETVIQLADERIKEVKRERRLKKVDAIIRRFNARPPLTDKSVEDIPGYNKDGLFD